MRMLRAAAFALIVLVVPVSEAVGQRTNSARAPHCRHAVRQHGHCLVHRPRARAARNSSHSQSSTHSRRPPRSGAPAGRVTAPLAVTPPAFGAPAPPAPVARPASGPPVATSTNSTGASIPPAITTSTTTTTTQTATTTTTSPTSGTTATTSSSTTAPARSATSTGTLSTACDLYAATTGSDASGDGSSARPFASLVKLDRALAPGQTGCLQAGTYGTTHTWHELNHSGTAAGRITLTAAPGQQVTVVGWVDLEGSDTTISHLNIDGSNDLYTTVRAGVPCQAPASQGLAIAGANDVFEYNNLYQSVAGQRGVGIGIGWWGQPDNTIVRFNQLHDVGGCQAFDHIVYLAGGNNVQVYGNWMWNDPHGWGVQVYPHPTNARIFDNVIDHAGSGFVIGSESGEVTSGNQIWNNVVTNSTGLANAGTSGVAISDYWGGSPGNGNTFNNNDSFGNPGGISRVTAVSLTANTSANPGFADPSSHDYAVASASPVAAWGLWDGRGL